MYLNSINHFRGIAIVFIVAGHCVYGAGWLVDTVVEKWVANLVLGGTALFVFISGFLFHHVHYSQFDYGSFLKAKARRVLLPYLFLSTPLVLYRVLIEGPGPHAENFSYVAALVDYLWTGKVLIGYWFVPFIFVMFALSPAIMAFIRLRPRVRLLIVCFTFLISLVVQRPVANLAVMQSLVYFLPIYLLGVVASIHRQTIYACLAGRELHLAILIGVTAGIQAHYYPSFGNLHKPALLLGPPDIVLIQKMLMCLALMVFLHRFEDRSSPLLGLLASTSFAVFFLHAQILWGAAAALRQLGYPAVSSQGPYLWMVMTPVVILVSVGLAKLVRLVFKERSILLIGW